MTLRDSGELDNAVYEALNADAELKMYAPDGVYFDEAPQGMNEFVIVSLIEGRTRAQMADPTARRGVEEAEYIVKVVMLGSSSANARTAAKRIDAVLEDQVIPIDGYTCLSIVRTGRIRDTEVDSVDASIRWQHRGGHYRVTAAPDEGAA